MTRHELSALPIAIAAYVIFSIGDGLVRSMAGQWPGPAIALLRYVIAAVVLGGLLAGREGRSGFAWPMPLVQIGRGGSLAMGTACFFTSLGFMPLSDATAISFTTPMWAASLSVLFLGERIGWAKAGIIGLAFGGVLIILRPNLIALGLPALLPLFGASFMAMMMMFNRRSAGSTSILASQFLIALIATIFLIPVVAIGHLGGNARFVAGWPSWIVVAKCAGVACTGTIGHLLLYLATTRASAAAVAPMSYVQMLMAITISWLAFATPPSPITLFGVAVIIGAGLLLFRISLSAARDVGEAGGTPD